MSKSLKQDGSKQYYLDGADYPELINARITLIDRRTINSDKDWYGSGFYIKFQSYTGKGNRLHKGLEIPFEKTDQLFSIIKTLIELKDKLP
ncbi:MAG: hypothetical protein FWE18_03180 [Alphaproteobacteria bacterium]|nr:hypothetical protein [Alphaproteobacteria bacterium]